MPSYLIKDLRLFPFSLSAMLKLGRGLGGRGVGVDCQAGTLWKTIRVHSRAKSASACVRGRAFQCEDD